MAAGAAYARETRGGGFAWISQFVSVVYISTSPEKLWNALTDPKMTVQYWQHENVSDWQPGSRWEHRRCDNGTVDLVGKVLESSPPRRLVLTWALPADQASESGIPE